ncbi:MAG: transketolase C-terminal domain-containing protein [Pseudomonadota bacterium]
MVSQGERIALLSLGTRLGEVMTAAEALASHGVIPTVVDARFAKPLDTGLILELVATHEAIITIEEGSIGGFGSHVAQFLSDEGVFDRGFKFRSMILPDRYLDHGRPSDMYATAGLNAAAIEAKVLALLDPS